MPECSKTKAQLAEELRLVKERLAALEESEREYKRTTKDQIREQLAELDNLYRTAPVGLCLLDSDLRYVRINERLAAINGPSPAEHIGRTVAEVIPELADVVVPIYRRAFATGEPALNIDVHGCTPAQPGVERHWHVSYVPLRVGEGPVQGVNIVVADVTDRMQTLKALQVFQRIVSATPDHMSFVDSDYVYREVNDAYLAAFERTREQIIGHTVAELLGDEVFETTARPNLDRCFSGEPVSCQQWFQFPGAGKRHLDVTFGPFRDKGGTITGAVITSRDITDRTGIEDRLRLLSAAVEQSSEGVAIVDIDGKLLFSNKSFAQMHGYGPEELLGKHLSIFHTPEQMPSVNAANRIILETGSFAGEIWHVHRDGTVFPTLMHNSRLHDEAGNPVGIIGTLQDITERKMVEESLREEGKRAQSYLDLAGVMFVALDAVGTVTLVNRKACEVLGYAEAEIIGKNWFDTCLPQRQRDAVKEVARRLLRGEVEPVEYYENPLLTRDGEERLIAWHNSVFRDAEGAIIGHLSSGEDITVRKRAEDALRESQERFDLAQAAGNVGVWDWNPNTGGLLWSEATYRILGLSPGECRPSYELFLDRVHADDRGRLGQAVEAALYKRRPYDIEFRIVWKDGSERMAHAQGEVRFDAGGRPLRMLGTFQDITDRKAAEEKLRENLIRSKAILDQTFQFIGLLNPDGILLEANRSSLEFGGLRDSDVIGKPFWETPWWAHSPEQQDLVRHAVERAAAGEFVRFEASHPAPDGTTRYVDASLKPVRDESGEVCLVIPEGRDITDLKRAEDDRRGAEELYRALFEQAADSIVVLDPDTGLMTEFNDRTCLNLGYSREEFEKLELAGIEAIESPEEISKHVQRIMELGADTFETKHRHKLGELRDVLVASRAISVRGRRLIVSIWRDITESKRTENALREARDELESRVRDRTKELKSANERLQREMTERTAVEEQASKQRAELAHLARLDTAGEMVSGITHELGQPLAVILSGAEACARLLKDGTGNTDELIAALDRLAAQAERAGSVVNSFKRFVRRQEPSPSPIDLNALVTDALEMARPEAAGLGATLLVDLADHIAQPVGDSVQIMQVTLNLIRNALDAVAECDPAARRVAVSTAMAAGESVEIAVRDAGIGPATESIDQMFVPFYSTKPDGMGIGLSLSRSIVEAHHGKLTARRNRDRGMTFVLTLPITE